MKIVFLENGKPVKNQDEYFVGADGNVWFLDDNGACGDPECCGERSYYMSIDYSLTWEIKK